MATSKSVQEFVAINCVVRRGYGIPMPVFRDRCKRWCIEQGYTAPSSRLITKVLRDLGVVPAGARYEWHYDGIAWFEPGREYPPK